MDRVQNLANNPTWTKHVSWLVSLSQEIMSKTISYLHTSYKIIQQQQ